MLNTRLTAARRITEALVPSEADIEAAITSTSRLIGAIAQGRSETNLSVSLGQDALHALGAVMNSLIDARGRLGEAHAALAVDRVEAGLSAYGMGDVSQCPKTAQLGVVEQQRTAA